MHTNLQHTLIRLYLIKASKWFMLTTAFLPLFLETQNIHAQGYTWLMTTSAITMILMKLPAGLIADRWGRKRSLMIGSVLGVAGFSIYAFTTHITLFILAEILLGMGSSFISGADSALLYEALNNHKKTSEFAKHEGRIMSVGNIMEMLAAPIGGVLAANSANYPFIAQVLIAAIAIPASFTLIEPTREKQKHIAFRDQLPGIKEAFKSNPALKWFIAFSAIIGASTLSMAKLVALYLTDVIKLEPKLIGTTWTILNFAVASASLYSHKINKHFQPGRAMLLIAILNALGFLALGLTASAWALVFLFLYYLMRGFSTPLLKNYINLYAPSNSRATILSLRMLTIRLIFAILFPLTGWISSHYNLQTALITVSAFFIICGLTPVWFLKHSKENK